MTCVGYMCGRQREGLENGKTDFFVCLFCLFDVLDMAKNDVDTMDDDAIERALLVEEEKKKEEEAREDAGLKEMEREMQQKLALAIQEAETKRQGKEEEYNRQLKLANDKANAKIAALEAREREMIEKEKEMKRKMEAESKKNEEKTKLLSEREKLMDILSKGREGTWWLVVGWFFTVVDELTFFPFSPFPPFLPFLCSETRKGDGRKSQRIGGEKSYDGRKIQPKQAGTNDEQIGRCAERGRGKHSKHNRGERRKQRRTTGIHQARNGRIFKSFFCALRP
jgi:hypothetical protein